MKRLFILTTLYGLIFHCFVMTACQKADPYLFEQDANIYFDLTAADRDSVVYTFAYDMTKSSDTIKIPVRISGLRLNKDRFYQAYIEKDSSSATEGEHYKKLDESYGVPSEQGQIDLPIIVYNKPDLEQNSVSIIVKLKASNDFDIKNPRIIRAKILLSARLEKPIWWEMWLGAYSRVKHQLFILTTEQIWLSTEGLDAPKNLYFADMLRLMLNNPFEWVTKNSNKGYQLTTKDDGTTYSFFHKDNPSRALLLRKNQGSGQYFFIDEQGMEVR